MNKRYFLSILILLVSMTSHSRNLSNSSREANEAKTEELVRSWKSQFNCLDGFKNDGSGNCVPVSNVIEPLQVKKQATTEKPNQVKKIETSEASLIAKNREEIVQRCGISESNTTKIVGMKDENQPPTIFVIDEVWGPRWIVTYRIDTGNVIFGERQFEKKICTIDKKTGAVRLRAEN